VASLQNNSAGYCNAIEALFTISNVALLSHASVGSYAYPQNTVTVHCKRYNCWIYL